MAIALGAKEEDTNTGTRGAGNGIKDFSREDLLITWKSMRLYHSIDKVSQLGESYHMTFMPTSHRPLSI